MKKLNDIAKIVHNELGEPPWRPIDQLGQHSWRSVLETIDQVGQCPWRSVLDIIDQLGQHPWRSVLETNITARTVSLDVCLGDQ